MTGAPSTGGGESALRRLGRAPFGSLLLLPLVIAFAGTELTCGPRLEPDVAVLFEPKARHPSEHVRLRTFPEGTASSHGRPLAPRNHVDVELPQPVSRFVLELQGDAAGRFEVGGSADGQRFEVLWTAPALPRRAGLTTRRSPELARAAPVRFLRIRVPPGSGPSGLSGVAVEAVRLTFSQAWLAVALWALAGLLLAALRRPALAPAAERIWAAWRRWDPWLSGLLVFWVLFRPPETLLSAAALVAGVAAAVALLRRHPFWTGGAALLALLAFVGVSAVLEAVVVAKVAETHELDVDHRLVPDGKDVNADGIRFRGSPEEFSEDDFVVAFLGDSFTYGLALGYAQTYPAVFEQMLGQLRCERPVRAVNMGWISSSPLLGLRLLREIGYRYRPDLVVYALDMSDFHDDLRYEIALREAGDFTPDTSAVVARFAQLFLPWLDREGPGLRALASLRRRPASDRAQAATPELPARRYFVTEAPLDETRPAIERGTMKHLGDLQVHANDVLAAEMVLVLLPRAYQYSLEESPDNWEAREYETLGPFAREPFRYFAERGDDLPFPVVDLLPVFETAAEAPLFRREDPHWSPAGARVAARGVARALLELELLPCAGAGS